MIATRRILSATLSGSSLLFWQTGLHAFLHCTRNDRIQPWNACNLFTVLLPLCRGCMDLTAAGFTSTEKHVVSSGESEHQHNIKHHRRHVMNLKPRFWNDMNANNGSLMVLWRNCLVLIHIGHCYVLSGPEPSHTNAGCLGVKRRSDD